MLSAKQEGMVWGGLRFQDRDIMFVAQFGDRVKGSILKLSAAVEAREIFKKDPFKES